MTSRRSGPQTVVIRLGAQVLIRISGLVSGLISVAVLARGLGHDDFGRFATCLSIVALASVVSELGLNSAAVREMSVRGEDRDQIARALLIARTWTSVIATVMALVAAAATFGWSNFWWPGVPVLFTLLLAPLTTGQARAQSELRLGAQNLLLLLQSWLWPIGILLLSAVGGGSSTYAWVFFASVLTCAVFAARLFGTPFARRVEHSATEVQKLLRLAAPYAVAGIFVTAYYRIGGLVLFGVAGANEAADFSAAFRLIDALQTLPAAILTVVLPLISRSFRPDRGAEERLPAYVFDLAIRATLFAGLPIAAGGSLVSRRIVEVLYGGEYSAAVPLLATLLLAYPAICAGYVLTASVVATGRSKDLVPITAAGAIINVAACVIFIPRGGAIAASIITLATELFIVAALTVLLDRRHRLRIPVRRLVQMVASTALMSGVLVPIRHQELWVTVPIGAVAYCAASWLLRTISPADLEVLRSRAAVVDTGSIP